MVANGGSTTSGRLKEQKLQERHGAKTSVSHQLRLREAARWSLFESGGFLVFLILTGDYHEI